MKKYGKSQLSIIQKICVEPEIEKKNNEQKTAYCVHSNPILLLPTNLNIRARRLLLSSYGRWNVEAKG